jgi:hypothetical protein
VAAYERKRRIWQAAVRHLDAFWDKRDALVSTSGLA